MPCSYLTRHGTGVCRNLGVGGAASMTTGDDAGAAEAAPPVTMKPRTTIRAIVEWAALITTIIAGVIAIVGIGVWLDEASDRADERTARKEEREARAADAEVRKIGLIGQAQASLAAEAADGFFRTDGDPQVIWAIETLQRYRVPIKVTAPRVDLRGFDLTCADLTIEAERVWFSELLVRKSVITITAKSIEINESGLQGSAVDLWETLFEGDAPSPHPLSISRSEIDGVRFGGSTTYKHAGGEGDEWLEYDYDHGVRANIVGTRAKRVTFDTGQGEFTYSLIGPDAELDIPNSTCASQRGMACGAVGTDMRPQKVGPQGETSVWIDLTEPACVRPAMVPPDRFEMPVAG